MTTTARHKLPLLVPGQAQKEVFHNEALSALDMLLHAAVEAVGIDAPPPAPADGQSWIVGAAPTGAWTGHADAVATWTGGGWRFQDAVAGVSVVVRATRLRAEWDGAAWRTGEIVAAKMLVGGVQVVGDRQAAIPAPQAGRVIDAEARTAVAAMLAALRAHGLIA